MIKLIRILLLVQILLYAKFSSSQQRIGFDFSSRFNNINTTFNYQRVIKKHLLFSTGFSFGRYGHSYIENTHNRFEGGFRYFSPFEQVNQAITDTSGAIMNLYEYSTKGRGLYFQLGLGYYYEFGVVHGLRFNTYFKFGIMKSNVLAGYYNDSITAGTLHSYTIRHYTSAISPEIYHTIRIGGRTTFYYGLKFPHYFSLFKDQFNPKYSIDLFNYWEPEISMGLTYTIGKCD